MFAAELDGAFRKAPFRESGYTGIHQDIFYLLWATNMPSVLLELGFISNPADYSYLSTYAGQEKIAQRLFDAFKVYKTNFDASMDVVSAPVEVEKETKPAPKTETKQEVQQEIKSESKGETKAQNVHYGVQIMGLGRKLSANDPALKGLSVEIVQPAAGTSIYKYVAAWSDNLDAAKSQLAAVRKKFPDAFLVQVDGTTVTRVK